MPISEYTVKINCPTRITFSQRIRATNAAKKAYLDAVEEIIRDNIKSIVEQSSEMVMNKFDLKPSQAKMITEYVLKISGTYNHFIAELNRLTKKPE